MELVKVEKMEVSRSWNTPRSKNHDEGPPQKKRKKNNTEIIVSPKNPVMALNEIKPNIDYIITASGPPHARIYCASVTINGQNYRAEDTTKKKAKAKVAQMILQCSVQLKDPSVKTPLDGAGFTDFSQDLSEVTYCNPDEFFSFETAVLTQVQSAPIITPHPESAKLNPVYHLNKIKPGISIDIVKEEGSPHSPIFTARVVIEEKVFEGVGSSKKQAKNEAAQLALKNAFGLELPSTGVAISKFPNGDANQVSDSDFGDFIARKIESAYQDIMKDEQSILARYKVLAGIVMTDGPTTDEATVICVTTGSKCIGGGQLSLEGEALNDCHAEILARRGLVSYLYDQLNAHYADPSKATIFESYNSDNGQRLKVRSTVLFHLFISSAPCGDARIFTLNDSMASPLEDLHPNRQGRGFLRTKIESGEGTVPVNQSVIQTWDGILQGERLLTMSCSDKIARWNVVGVQGSLLSHLIDPIYFHTIVVGSLFHQVHLRRALIGRIEHLQGLPHPFIFHRPVLSTISSPQDRLPSKSPKTSIVWVNGWPQHEVVDIVKGKLEDGSPSRLSKRSLFQRFTSLRLTNHNRKALIENHLKNGHLAYVSLKKAARAFEEAKETFQASFSVAKLGHWVKKPLEQDSFEIRVDGSQISETSGPSVEFNSRTNDNPVRVDDCPPSPIAF